MEIDLGILHVSLLLLLKSRVINSTLVQLQITLIECLKIKVPEFVRLVGNIHQIGITGKTTEGLLTRAAASALEVLKHPRPTFAPRQHPSLCLLSLAWYLKAPP